MKRVEKVIPLIATSPEDLAKQYNDWYEAQVDRREVVPQLKGQVLQIRDRLFSQMPKGKGTQFGLLVFFEDFLFEENETGPDRGKHLDSGVSVVRPYKR